MIIKGTNKGMKVYKGDVEIAKMYRGDNLIYENIDTTNYFALTASEASTIGISGSYAYSLQYSTDRKSWSTFDSSVTISLNSGDLVYFRGTNTRLGSSASVFTQFVMTGALTASGNIMSLLYGRSINGKLTIPNSYCFTYLFYNCTALRSVANLELPATTLKTYCYYHMFHGCTSLTNAPVLPATTLTNYVYHSMFYGCTALTTAPALPATTLGTYCYHSMFYGCTSLVNAPVLSATATKTNCYQQMFYNCTSLTTAPALPATTLTSSCYYSMFYGCTSLVNAPALPAVTAVSNCYYNMFRGCTNLVNPPAMGLTTLVGNCCNSMFYGCTKLTTAPVLSSETLIANCYSSMFRNCSVLSYIKMLAINGADSSWGSNWLTSVPNVASSIFVKHISAEWTKTGASGVPTSWTVIYYDPSSNKYYLSDKTTECDDHGNVL